MPNYADLLKTRGELKTRSNREGLNSYQAAQFKWCCDDIIRANKAIADFLVQAQNVRENVFTTDELSRAIAFVMKDSMPDSIISFYKLDKEDVTSLATMNEKLENELAKAGSATISQVVFDQYKENADKIADLVRERFASLAKKTDEKAAAPVTEALLPEEEIRANIIEKTLLKAESAHGKQYNEKERESVRQLIMVDIHVLKIIYETIASNPSDFREPGAAKEMLREKISSYNEVLLPMAERYALSMKRGRDDQAVYGGNPIQNYQEDWAIRVERKAEALALADRSTLRGVGESFSPTPPVALTAGADTTKRVHAPVSSADSQKREQLMRGLETYISRIENNKKSDGLRIDFAHGFKFYRKSQALNREVNYFLAKKMLAELQKPTINIEQLFSAKSINALRSLVINEHKFTIRADYVDRGINSAELSEIIKSGQKVSAPLPQSSVASVAPEPKNDRPFVS